LDISFLKFIFLVPTEFLTHFYILLNGGKKLRVSKAFYYAIAASLGLKTSGDTPASKEKGSTILPTKSTSSLPVENKHHPLPPKPPWLADGAIRLTNYKK